jgi:MFS family permease
MTAGRADVRALCLVQFVDVLGVTVVISALPTMLASLRAGASSAGPVMTAYAVLFGGLLMLGARLGDRYGHRRVLLTGLAVFVAGSFVAATATTVTVLVAARCLQGLAAALSVPTALRLLTAAAPGEDSRRQALALWSASGAVAGALGLLLGGVVSQVAGWRVVFWALVPAAVLLMLAVTRWVGDHGPGARVGLDVAGALALTVSVMALVLGCSLLQDQRWTGAIVLFAVAGILAAALFRVERGVRQPLLPATALRHPQLIAGSAGSFVNTAATSSTMTLATLALQGDHGESPSEAGLTLLPFSLLVVLASAAFAPRLMRRDGPYVALAVGLVCVALGNGVLSVSSGAVPAVPFGVGVAGLGLGVAAVSATTIATDVPDELAGTAAGLLNTAAQLGTALGVALVVLVATSGAGWGVGWGVGWAVAGAMAMLGALLTWRRRSTALPAVVEPARGGAKV